MAATETRGLKRELGGWTTTSVVVGNMIGSGVFLPAALAVVALEYGSGSLLAWAVTGAGAMLLAMVFARLGRAYPRTGGPYVYVRRAFGDFMGFQTAWGYWIAAWVGNAAIATASSVRSPSSSRSSAKAPRLDMSGPTSPRSERSGSSR